MEKRGIDCIWAQRFRYGRSRASWVAAILLIAMAATGAAQGSSMIIGTSSPDSTLIADGQTQYTLAVYADSRGIPDIHIRSAEWDVVVPDFITITGAQLPSPENPSTNPDDFFYGFVMHSTYNRVDSTVSGGELTSNDRLIAVNAGSQNRIGDLGYYSFTVNPDAPLGNFYFSMNGIYFYDVDYNPYDVMNDNLTRQYHTFTVVPEPATATLLLTSVLAGRFLTRQSRRRT